MIDKFYKEKEYETFYQVSTLGRYVVISRYGIDFDKSKNWGMQVEYSDLNYIIYKDIEKAKETLEKIQDEFPLDSRFCLLQYVLEKDQYEKNTEYKIVKQVLPVNISLIEVM